jgi:hypothetical protein
MSHYCGLDVVGSEGKLFETIRTRSNYNPGRVTQGGVVTELELERRLSLTVTLATLNKRHSYSNATEWSADYTMSTSIYESPCERL